MVRQFSPSGACNWALSKMQFIALQVQVDIKVESLLLAYIHIEINVRGLEL